jgi:hypothetical protein
MERQCDFQTKYVYASQSTAYIEKLVAVKLINPYYAAAEEF